MNEQLLALEPVLAWAGLALLLVLCLPFAGVQKLLLEVYGLVLRLALLALVGAAGYLWFRPDMLPAQCVETLNNFPPLRELLPEPGTRSFGVAAVAVIAAALLPLLAVLDVSRKLAGWRLRRLRLLTASGTLESLPVATAPAAQPAPPPRRVDRRGAADALAQAGARKPFRVADHLVQ